MGLWATIESCVADLEGSPYKYEFIIVVNGEDETADHKKIKHYLGHAHLLRDWIQHDAPLSPPTARQLGTESATGELLFFFDNHCLVRRDYFKRALQVMQNSEVDELHSTTAYYSGFELNYHYNLRLRTNFWGVGVLEWEGKDPYRIAMGGHGGFVVRRKVWEEVGGYWRGFTGYGGEETYFDLKMWLLGKQVWLAPKVVHAHYAGERPYPRHFSDDYYFNVLACANIIGGERWMLDVFECSRKQPRMRTKDGNPVVPLYDILQNAYERSQPHAEWLASKRLLSLDELLEQFKHERIAC